MAKNENKTDTKKVVDSNLSAIAWPIDVSGRAAPMRKAFKGLANVRGEALEATIMKTLEVGTAWLVARAEANRMNAQRKVVLASERADVAAKVAAEAALKEAEAEVKATKTKAEDAAKALKELKS